MRVPVAVATESIVFPIIKVLPPVRTARALANAMAWGGAAAVIAQAMINEHNSETGQNVTYNTTNNYYENNSTIFAWNQIICGPNPLNVTDPRSTIEACIEGTEGGGWTYGNYVWTCTATDTYGCRSYGLTWNTYRYGGFWSSNQGGVGRASNTYVSQTTTPLSDAQVSDIVEGYSQPYNQRDFWEPYPGATQEQISNFDEAGSEPLRLTDTQIQDLNEQLATACDPAGDLLVYELCLMGREHGVTSSPPSTDVPEATQPDGGTYPGGSVNVEVPTDTPGGVFEAETLEEVGTFQATTDAFLASVQAAPIVAAWTGIGATVPAGACPTASVTVFGTTFQLMTIACEIWEESVVPLLSLVFLFVWPFIGLRIVMSS